MRRPILSATLLFLCVSTPALAQWTWLNPKPQGHTLNDVEFLSESVAIAVGEDGTVLGSYDGGASWEIVTTRLNGIDLHFSGVTRLDNSTAVAVGDGGRIAKTTDAGVNWTELASGTTQALRDVHFVTPMHGMAVGQNVALRTSNGGQTWQSLTLPFTFNLSGIHMLSLTNAFAVGLDGFLLRTTTGGDSWTYELFHFPGLTDVSFVDPMNGTIVGSNGAVFRTTNGGSTWSELSLDEVHFSRDWQEVVYIDASNLLLAGLGAYTGPPGNPFEQPWGEVWSSSNAGGNWAFDTSIQLVARGAAASPSGAIRLIVGDGGAILRSSGGDFQLVGGSTESYLDGTYAASFIDVNTGVVAGSSCECNSNETVFLRTTNGGQTWSRSQKTNHSTRDLEHTSPTVLYSVGTTYFANGASILKSTDGGATWSQVWASTTVTDLLDVEFSSPTHGVAVGKAGKVVILDHDVASVFDSGVTGYLEHVAFAGPSTLVAIGHDGQFGTTVYRMVRSIDGGESWSPVDYGPATQLTDVEFVSDLAGFSVGSGGLLIKTEDAGATWTPISSGTSANLRSIAFTDTEWGVIVTSAGAVRRTFDGGAAWDDAPAGVTPLVGRVEYPERGRAYLFGQQLFVVAYDFEESPTAIAELPSTTTIELLPNFPNPFNPSTTIRYILPSRERVRVSIYDVSGRLVTTLVDQDQTAGSHDVEWKGTDAVGTRVSSGVYLVRIEAGKQSLSRKMVLLK